MKKYGYFHSMLMSFYSRNLYRDVYENWGGRVLWYLFLVLAIYTVCTTTLMQTEMNAWLPPFLEKYAVQVPELIIKDGVISTPENRPYLIINPDTQKTVGIIDTSGKYTNLDNQEAEFLLTQNTIISHENQEIRERKLPSTLNADLKPEEIKNMTLHGARWAWLLIFPVTLIFIYFFRIIQTFFYALLGKILSLLMSVKISYFDIFKLCVVALTPAIVLRLIITLSIGSFPLTWLVCFLVAMGYLVFAINSVSK